MSGYESAQGAELADQATVAGTLAPVLAAWPPLADSDDPPPAVVASPLDALDELAST
jgi:hypothetical protein